jgi:NAD(P)-dependent dehydrogenase (short-subunit alcohol dehydrogenase family)
LGQEVAGKVAIVTGGASGLGRATAALLADEGAHVVIADVDAEGGADAAREIGASGAFKQTDVSDADQVQAAVDFAVSEFGGLHIMFNNAGIGGSHVGFLKDDFRDFERTMAVNVLGVMLGTQRAGRYMAEHGGGVIINTTSIGGINAGAGVTAYRAAKAGVIHFTKCAAIELAPHFIRVNCVAPAHIATAINTTYDQAEIVKRMQPLQRMASPDDVANAVLYLASERAAQITGIVMPIDGGTTVGPPARDVREVLAKQGDAR